MGKINRYKELVPYLNCGNPNWKLLRYVLFETIKRKNLNICYKCKQIIDTLEEFTVSHKVPWRTTRNREGDKDLFWDLNNIAFEHSFCNLPDDWTNQFGYKGIHHNGMLKNGQDLYKSAININNKTIILGYSTKINEVAEMYDLGVMKYRQGKGILNFPEKRQEYIERLKNEQTPK